MNKNSSSKYSWYVLEIKQILCHWDWSFSTYLNQINRQILIIIHNTSFNKYNIFFSIYITGQNWYEEYNCNAPTRSRLLASLPSSLLSDVRYEFVILLQSVIGLKVLGSCRKRRIRERNKKERKKERQERQKERYKESKWQVANQRAWFLTNVIRGNWFSNVVVFCTKKYSTSCVLSFLHIFF